MKIIRDVSEEIVFREFYEVDFWGKRTGVSFEQFINSSRESLIKRMPPIRNWKEVSLEQFDYTKLRVMAGAPPWHLIQSGTLDDCSKILLTSTADDWVKIRNKVNAISISGAIDQRGFLFITDMDQKLPLTIIEGHHRILALFSQNKMINRCYVAFCKGDSNWMRMK